MLLDLLSRYYGVDIAAMILTFLGLYLIGNKKKSGFIIASTGNLLWMLLGVITQAVGLIFANVVIIILYSRGHIKWSTSNKK